MGSGFESQLRSLIGGEAFSFPVCVPRPGHVDPQRFSTDSYVRAEADYLARQGYLTLSPDYHGHAGSEDAGPDRRDMNTFDE